MANYDLTYEGSRVQGILDTGDELRDAGYIFRGEATPSTVPGTPTERVAYIGGPGTYTNFGSTLVVPSGSIGVFKYTGSAWSNEVIACTVPISTSVQNNDTTVPTGKAVKAAVDAVSGAVGTEATARADADTALGTRIDNEATARGNADTALQNAINTINTKLAEGYVYVGIATATTNPGTPTGKVFYIATAAGTYTNFGNAVVTAGLNVLKYNGSAWSVDQVIAIDAEPTQGSDNLVKSGGVLNSIIQNGPAFDLSAYNAQGGVLATYANLSAALTALNALSADFKKGGMSIKFVLSSDNNYIQFRCKTQSFSANPEDWYFEGDDTLVENPEYLRAITDGAGHLLGWIRKEDGGIDWAVGVPKPVKDYVAVEIAKILNGSASTDIDGINKIIAFLDDFSTSDTLAELLATKVDKEDDKSLIPTQYIQEVENPEYTHALTDNNDKVTEATKKDGGKLFGGDVEVRGEMSAKEVSAEKILLNGEMLSPTATVDVNSIIEDPEGRLKIETDTENKIISYRKPNGTLVENVGIETNHLELTEEGMNDFQQALINTGFNPKDKIDWSDQSYIHIPQKPTCAVINITGVDNLPQNKGVNSHAWMEVWDKNGNYFKKRVILDAQGRSSLQQAKKNFAADFCEDEWEGDDTTTIKIGDWVSQDSFHFKAYYTDLFKMANIISYKLWENFKNTMPFTENKPYKEYFATDYSSTSSSDKDFTQNTKDEAKCVPDGFPVMVYLNGDFYGLFSWQLKKHRDNYLLDRNATDNIHLDSESYTSLFNGNVIWTNTEIRNPKPKKSKWTLYCMDGSKYDGDNPKELIDDTSENWDATNTSHIKSAQTKANILAVSQYMSEINALKVITTSNGDITLGAYAGIWNETDNFGKGVWVSDGDSYYMSLHTSNTNHPISSDAYWIDITTNINNIKTEINKRFGVKWMIDYVILINLERNGDSIIQNTQWITWGKLNGKMKWYPCPYDLDASFGIISATSFNFTSPGYVSIGATNTTPIRYVYAFYQEELKARWKELRDNKIIDKETFIRMLKEWIDDIGNDNLSMEYDKWNESPCNRDASISNKWEMTGNVYISYGATNTWYGDGVFGLGVLKKYNNRCYRSLQANNNNHRPDISPEWWEDVTIKAGNYAEDDVIYDGYNNFYEFRAKEAITVSEDSNSTNRQDHLVNTPFTKLYNLYPNEGGVYESIYRIYKWVSEQIALMDSAYDYNQN